eukprot:535728_1
MAEHLYLEYITEFGYTPKQSSHLTAFAKTKGKSLTWKDAKNVIKNPPNIDAINKPKTPSPTSSKPNPYIDDKLKAAPKEYNPQKNKQFKQKHKFLNKSTQLQDNAAQNVDVVWLKYVEKFGNAPDNTEKNIKSINFSDNKNKHKNETIGAKKTSTMKNHIMVNYDNESYTFFVDKSVGSYTISDLRLELIEKYINEPASSLVFKLESLPICDYKMDIISYFQSFSKNVIVFNVEKWNSDKQILKPNQSVQQIIMESFSMKEKKLIEDLKKKMSEFNFRICSSSQPTDDDVKQSLNTNATINSFEFDLQIPTTIVNDSCFSSLKHSNMDENESHCNIVPMLAVDENTKIVPFTLDIDINDFCDENNLDVFLNELSNMLNMDATILNGLCVSEGSSIIWIKLKNMEQNTLQTIIDSFIAPKQHVKHFIHRWKVNIHKTIDVTAKTFKHVIEKFKKKTIINNDNNIISSDTNIELLNKWMNNHIDKLYPLIYDSLKFCHYDFKIIDCMVVDVPKRIEAFQQHKYFEKSKLLFHGTNTKHFASIINNGFMDTGSIGKWYGKGFYFTSYPIYAIEYYCMKQGMSTSNDNLCATLIASLVNVGNVKEIYANCGDIEIPEPYDSHHIRVFGTGWKRFKPAPIGKNDKINVAQICVCGNNFDKKYGNKCSIYGNQCNNCDQDIYSDEHFYHCKREYLNIPDHDRGYDLCLNCFELRKDELCGTNTKFTSTNDRVYDEYAVRESSRIVPRYLIKLQKVKKVFVWRNTTFDQYPNEQIYAQIAQNNVVYVCKDTLSALKVIELKKKFCDLYVISNSQDGKKFIGECVINTLGIESNHILIFTGSVSWTKQWANIFNVEVTGSPSRVISFVQENGMKI